MLVRRYIRGLLQPWHQPHACPGQRFRPYLKIVPLSLSFTGRFLIKYDRDTRGFARHR